MTSVLRLEARRSLMLTALPLLVFLCGLAAWRDQIPGVAWWPATTLGLLASLQLLGPALAGLAAFAATRERRRRVDYLRLLSVEREASAPVLHLLGLMVWGWAAFLFVSIAAVILAGVQQAPGWFDPSVLLFGLGSVALHTVVGYAAGWLLPRFVTAPVVAFAAYLYVVVNLDYAGTWFYLLAPVAVERPNVFVPIQAEVVPWMGLWLCAVAVLLVVLFRAAEWARKWRGIAVAVALAAGCLAGLAVWQLQSYDGHVFASPTSSVDRVCGGREPEVCVHPAMKSAIPALRRAFGPVLQRLDGTPGAASVLRHASRNDATVPAAGTRNINLDDLRPGFAQAAVREYVEGLSASEMCFSTRDVDSVLYTYLVSDWLVGDLDLANVRPEHAGDLRWFRALSEQTRHDWLLAHYAEFATCRLTAASFTTG